MMRNEAGSRTQLPTSAKSPFLAAIFTSIPPGLFVSGSVSVLRQRPAQVRYHETGQAIIRHGWIDLSLRLSRATGQHRGGGNNRLSLDVLVEHVRLCTGPGVRTLNL